VHRLILRFRLYCQDSSIDKVLFPAGASAFSWLVGDDLNSTDMKRLTLIRHAKSSWKDPECADFDRPLAKRGKNDALIMGRRLAERGESPSLILSSPARRALATMKRIADAMGGEKTIVPEVRLYQADYRDLLGLVGEIEDVHGAVILCGHNPEFTDFCNFVADSRIEKIPTCGVVSLDFSVDSWKEIGRSIGRIRYCDWPKKLSLCR
jgi:phosphohistidine phosphatase